MSEKTNVQIAKEAVMKGEGYLHIKRLPKNTSREIIDFLNDSDEFGGDWAIGMKFIWDTFKGTIAPKDNVILQELELLHQRMNELEQKCGHTVVRAESKRPRMANGRLRGTEENGKI
jgi:hypothetical protein